MGEKGFLLHSVYRVPKSRSFHLSVKIHAWVWVWVCVRVGTPRGRKETLDCVKLGIQRVSRHILVGAGN